MEKSGQWKGLDTVKKNRLLFYIIGVSLPVLQFSVFYIGVNINSILLAFKSYERVSEGVYAYSFAGLENFSKIIQEFSSLEYMRIAIGNSLLIFAFTFLAMGLSLAFSYYIMKKMPGSKLFQLLLYLPNILSAIIMTVIYKYFVENFVPALYQSITGKEAFGLLSSTNITQTLFVIIFYCVFSGFGQQVLLFGGTMSGISDSVIDAAKVDGAGAIREFSEIVLPMIFPTIATFIVVAVAGLFTNQMGLFSFYGLNAEKKLYTIGYYLYMMTNRAGKSGLSEYPYLAAFGLIISFVTIPLTILVRKLLNKLGPSFE